MSALEALMIVGFSLMVTISVGAFTVFAIRAR